jgi:hypothetical protein
MVPPLCEFSSAVFVVFWISEFHYRAILNFIWPFWAFGASFQTEDARHEYLPPAAFGARFKPRTPANRLHHTTSPVHPRHQPQPMQPAAAYSH